MKTIFEITGVTPQVYAGTAKYYMSNPEYMPQLEKELTEVEKNAKKHPFDSDKKLTREEAFECIKFVEE